MAASSRRRASAISGPMRFLRPTAGAPALPRRSLWSPCSTTRPAILLCGGCKHGFDWKKHGYYNVAHYEQILATGVCDVCKEHSPRLELLLHEATRGGCWSTKDEQKALRKKAISVGY